MAIALKDLLEERLKRSTSPSSGSFSLKPSSIPFPQHFRTDNGTFSSGGGSGGDSGVINNNDFNGSSIEFLLSSSPPAHLERVPQSYRPLIPTSTPSMAINTGVGRKEMMVTTSALQPSTPTPPSASSSSLLLSTSTSLSLSIPESMKSRKERKRRLRMAKFPTESETNVEDGDGDQIFHFSTSIGGAFGSLGDY